jgi:NADPH-dependent F420 reductase
MSDAISLPIVAIIGGTGKEGSTLARRFAKAGVRTLIGSRDAEKARRMATDINKMFNTKVVEGYSNCEAADKAQVVAITLPYFCMMDMLAEIKRCVEGKIVINLASSLDPEKKSRAKLNPHGSITQEAQDFLGENVKVIAAFQNIAPEQLESLGKVETDVLVCGGDREARDTVICLVRTIGMEAYDIGAIQNAVVVETLTAALIAINIRYKVRGAGIHIVGIPQEHPHEHES